jgi:hypothetical protein
MAVYELATLRFKPDHTPRGLPRVRDFLASQRRGRLVGSWRSEISRQHLLLVLRRFEAIGELFEDREVVLTSSDPFGCGSLLADLSLEAHAPFPGFEDVPPGSMGPYFEFRSYKIPPEGLAPTLEAWSDMVPRRSAVSRPAVIMYGLDGKTRFTHVWPYPSLADRERLRAEALERGLWPPASAPRWLTEAMRSEIFLPTDFSPLQ